MTAPRPSITGDLPTQEPDDALTVVEPWIDPDDPDDEPDRDGRTIRDRRPMREYFERMRERGLLD